MDFWFASTSWVIVKSTTINMDVETFFFTLLSILLDLYPIVGLLDHGIVLFSIFWNSFSVVAVQFPFGKWEHLTKGAQRF